MPRVLMTQSIITLNTIKGELKLSIIAFATCLYFAKKMKAKMGRDI